MTGELEHAKEAFRKEAPVSARPGAKEAALAQASLAYRKKMKRRAKDAPVACV